MSVTHPKFIQPAMKKRFDADAARKAARIREVAEEAGIRHATDAELDAAWNGPPVRGRPLDTPEMRAAFCRALGPLVNRDAYARVVSLQFGDDFSRQALAVANGWQPPRVADVRIKAEKLRAEADALDRQADDIEPIEAAERERLAADEAARAKREADLDARHAAYAAKKAAEAARLARAAHEASPLGRLERDVEALKAKLSAQPAGGAS